MIESVLAADIGSVWTKVVLLDRVDGRFRFLARGQAITSTLPGLGSDGNGVMNGLRGAIQQVERITGRRLLNGGQLITPETGQGHGVDAFVAVTSAPGNLGLVVAGLERQRSVEAALRAAAMTYSDVRGTLSANGGLPGGSRLRWFGFGSGGLVGMIDALPALTPDAVLLVGGTDGGTVAPVADLAKALAAARIELSERLPVVFAGNVAARETVSEILAGQLDLRVAENVAPAVGARNLGSAAQELEAVYRECKLGHMPGYDALSAWSSSGILPAASGFWLALRYLARHYHLHVLGVDVGASNTLLGDATEDAWEQSVHTGLGSGPVCGKVLASVGLSGLVRWLPFDISEEQVRDYVARRQEEPWSIPETTEEAWLEQALVREVLRSLRAAPTKADLIVATGGALANAWQPEQAILTLLDGLQPVGITQLAVDSALTVPALGAVAAVQPEMADQVLVGDALVRLGTVVSPCGWCKHGRPALRVSGQPAHGEGFQMEVAFGDLERLPVEAGQRVRLELRPGRGLDIGMGPGMGGATDLDVVGLGVFVDCRGRPFDPPADLQARSDRVQRWARSCGAWE